MVSRAVISLWFDGQAEQAATFYTRLFPDSELGQSHYAAADYPDGVAGDLISVEFTMLGMEFVAINGGPHFTPNESFSIQVVTENQEETDHYWNALVADEGSESVCGWCKDRWGYSWQITPRQLLEALDNPDRAAAARAMEAMLQMQRIDIASIEAAVHG